MPIPLATNFENNSILPLDADTVKDSMADLLASEWRKEGVLVYVKDEKKYYYWDGTAYVGQTPVGGGGGTPVKVLPDYKNRSTDSILTVNAYSQGLFTAVEDGWIQLLGSYGSPPPATTPQNVQVDIVDNGSRFNIFGGNIFVSQFNQMFRMEAGQQIIFWIWANGYPNANMLNGYWIPEKYVGIDAADIDLSQLSTAIDGLDTNLRQPGE